MNELYGCPPDGGQRDYRPLARPRCIPTTRRGPSEDFRIGDRSHRPLSLGIPHACSPDGEMRNIRAIGARLQGSGRRPQDRRRQLGRHRRRCAQRGPEARQPADRGAQCRAGSGQGAHRAQRAARLAHRPAQPALSRRHPASAMRRAVRSTAGSWRCCISISTASSRSTTRSATPRATPCWSTPPRCCKPDCRRRRFRGPHRRRRVRRRLHRRWRRAPCSADARRPHHRRRCAQPVTYEGHECRFGVSVGIASETRHAGRSAAAADQCRYRALPGQEPRPQPLRVLHRGAAGRGGRDQARRRRDPAGARAQRVRALLPAAVRRAHARCGRRRGAGALAPSDRRHPGARRVPARSPRNSTSSSTIDRIDPRAGARGSSAWAGREGSTCRASRSTSRPGGCRTRT